MTDHPDTLARYRLPLSRDHIQRAGALVVPALRYAPKNPLMLVGLLAGLGGYLVWRNRETISRRAGPMIARARTRGVALVDEAKITSQVIGAKAARLRRGDAGRSAVSDIY